MEGKDWGQLDNRVNVFGLYEAKPGKNKRQEHFALGWVYM